MRRLIWIFAGAHVQGYVFWRNDSIEFRENVLDKAFAISSNVFYL